MYYRNANAAIVVYDINNKQTFEKAKLWVNELLEKTKSNILIVLCGNKSDLEESREVSSDEASIYAEAISSFFIEVSAKLDKNIYSLFEEIANKLPKSKISKKEDVIDFNKKVEKKGCSC